MTNARVARAISLLLYMAVCGMSQDIDEVNIYQDHRDIMQLDQQLSHLSAQFGLMEGRVDATRQAIFQEITKLDHDVKTHSADIHATKTVVTTLVEDNVNMQGKIRTLQGVGSDVNGLRTRVDRVEGDVTRKMTASDNRIERVEGSLNSQWDAYQKVTVAMNEKLQGYETAISKLKNDVTSEFGKIKHTMEQTVTELREQYESRLASVERLLQK
ncbi:uncharacterized protein LOC127878970 isoform X2 [Dreissena polymorpha]|uniref:Uncharacterized protein n=2 Tax=Dreissena polymorpha TaxID=45954 RepID=A0A9D4HAY2_DREPO|nr:uncharacterized protein LOC127878970 isoform X2 [Dreissena polymorpha]XP_052281501.1 uncharacterized protein LOC127878970 isoform X2 [Dreissena polymorpha]XP_052281502.1 uncharacterized protein LOC127878970 isoform X2 [Dreissena polymorpha]XP_052281503.1 uncharacterized protein LOC127878970 isoform X2 [Dreissena polymorpha]KAH3830156.1 hypothetical protein DPMN_103394 [Dreissena polymorpha]